MPTAGRRFRILAFEAYDSGSHRAVRTAISRHSQHDWTWVTRPGRAWKWRMRVGALELLDQARAAGLLHEPPDGIFATSLLSLTDLVAGLPASLRGSPTILYVHENQAAYPVRHPSSETVERDVHFALTNLTSVLSADLAVFNSAWNLRSFTSGVEELLRAAPDVTLDRVAERIGQRSQVIWPPVEPPPAAVRRREEAPAAVTQRRPVRVVWPHRWEHDKGPEELLEIAERWSEPLDLRWTILGSRFRRRPAALAELEARFADRIDHIGFEPNRLDYWHRLAACDWVLSTARHEFFGVAVAEALLAGCLPWLPDRLSYPELLPTIARGLSPSRPPSRPEAVRAAVERTSRRPWPARLSAASTPPARPSSTRADPSGGGAKQPN